MLERAVSEGSGSGRVQNYLSALVAALQERQITALFTKETGPLAAADLELETDLSSGVAENMLWLQRVISVLKMRYSAHDLTLREFTITAPSGIEVRAPFESGRGVLAGIARQQGDPRRASPGGAQGQSRRRQGRPPPIEDPHGGDS